MTDYDLLFRWEGIPPIQIRVEEVSSAEEAMEKALPHAKRLTNSEYVNCYGFRCVEEDGMSPWSYLTIDRKTDPKEGEV